MTKNKIFSFVFILVVIGFIFSAWFSPSVVTSGDLTYSFASTMLDHTLYPFAWLSNQNNGLGGYAAPFISIHYNQVLIHIFSSLGLGWNMVERITQLFPVLFLLSISSYFLTKCIPSKFGIFSFLIFALNTYVLMLMEGGQILVAMAYALVPTIFFVFYRFAGEIIEQSAKNLFMWSIGLGILFTIEVMVDIRIAYILFVLCFLYFGYLFVLTKNKINLLQASIFLFIIPFAITGLLNAFWALPSVIVRQNPFQQLGSAYNSVAAVQYFSFAKFENTLGLLHPQWPENIFGKTYFMRPEFLLLPILAFASLLFVKPNALLREKNRLVLFFVLLGLVGVFLSKGANDPFGNIYVWMFGHIPGFIMFRDSTKWYIFVAISYSVLIPYTISKISTWVSLQTKFQISNFKFQINPKGQIFNLQNIFFCLVVMYLLFLIRPAVFGQLGGAFKTQNVPQEYIAFNNFLSNQSTFSRALWIPSWERFGYHNSLHPAVGAEDFYHVTSVSAVLHYLDKSNAQQYLQERSIKYIIVPFDVQGELFLNDRKYDQRLYEQTFHNLQKISWLKEMPGFGKLHVFVLQNADDHFWSDDTSVKIAYKKNNLASYILLLKKAKKGDRVIFSESYDRNWQLQDGNQHIASIPFENSLNSFVLPKEGNYTAIVYFTPQTWVNIGLLISAGTATLLLSIYIWMFLG